MKVNITLICQLNGFKKKVGLALAGRLQMLFADVDDIINYENSSLNELIKLNGAGYFEKIEEKTIDSVANFKNAIIVSSLASLLNIKNLKKIKENSLVIFLKVSKDLFCLEKRKENLNEKARLVIDEIVFDERNLIFEKAADILVEIQSLNEGDAVLKTIKKIKEFYNIK